jgi:hypothetical protein
MIPRFSISPIGISCIEHRWQAMSNLFGRLEDEIRFSYTWLRGGEFIRAIVFEKRDDVRWKDQLRLKSPRPGTPFCLQQFFRPSGFVSLRDKCALVDGGFVPGGSELRLSLRKSQLRDGGRVFLAFAEGEPPHDQDFGSAGDLLGGVSGFKKLEGK